MMHMVIALPAEAAPLVSAFRLRAEPDLAGFKLYAGEQLRLIVSGLGRVQAAAATAVLGITSGARDAVWINMGVAGHADLPLGTTVLAGSIRLGSLGATGQVWYPPLVVDAPWARLDMQTVDAPELEYAQPCVYEMEAAGFYPIACRFSTGELVQVLKVIADNRANPVRLLSKARLVGLMEQNLPAIAELLEKLRPVAATYAALRGLPPEFATLVQRWRFSVTRESQLRRLLERYRALGGADAMEPLQGVRSAQEVLRLLGREVDRLALASRALTGDEAGTP